MNPPDHLGVALGLSLEDRPCWCILLFDAGDSTLFTAAMLCYAMQPRSMCSSQIDGLARRESHDSQRKVRHRRAELRYFSFPHETNKQQVFGSSTKRRFL